MKLGGFEKHEFKSYLTYPSMQIVNPLSLQNTLNTLNVLEYNIWVHRSRISDCLLYEVPCFGCEFILSILEYDSHNFYSIFQSLYLKANETQQQGPSKILWIFVIHEHVLSSECCWTSWQCFMAISGVWDFKTTVWC